MIKNIVIDGFRGIQNLTIDQIARINVISGKNNAGKSSVLEALFLLRDHISPDSFSKMNTMRGKLFPENSTMVWEPLFCHMDTHHPIKIKVKGKRGTESIRYERDDAYIPVEERSISSDIMNQLKTAAKSNYTLKFVYKSGKYEENGHFIVGSGNILRQMSANKSSNEILSQPPTFFVNDLFIQTDMAIGDRIAKMILSGKKKELIRFLHYIDPSIEDIFTLPLNGIVQIFVKDKEHNLPVQYAGAGLNKLLYIYLAIMEKENGLVLIDEIEAGLHYSVYPALWEMIYHASQEYNCQVFATTHSYESVVSAIHVMRSLDDTFSYYRLDHKENETKAHRYDPEMIEQAISAELEVR